MVEGHAGVCAVLQYCYPVWTLTDDSKQKQSVIFSYIIIFINYQSTNQLKNLSANNLIMINVFLLQKKRKKKKRKFQKYPKENKQAGGIGSHFSHNGPINFISWPDCYICKDASVDTHIEETYVRHPSLLTSADYVRCQWWQMTDISLINTEASLQM